MNPLAAPCPYCHSTQGEVCRQGGAQWPLPALHPHRERLRRAWLIQWWEAFGKDTWQQMEARHGPHG